MKKIIGLLLAMIMAFALVACGDNEKLEWPSSGLATMLPVPSSDNGSVGLNLEDSFSADVSVKDKKEFTDYIEKCKEKGFTIINEENSDEYDAYNSDGYRVTLSYSEYSKDYSVRMESPKVNSDINWPTIGLAMLIPKPDGRKGTVVNDSTKQFTAYVGETSFDAYNEYVNKCIECGFNVDHSKKEKVFSADNADGVSLRLEYEGFDTMYISMYASSGDTEEPTSTTKKEETSKETETSTSTVQNNGISAEFKSAMDSYEAFFDEYVEFMNKYNKSDDTLGMLNDYMDFMSRYSEMMEKLNAVDSDELSTEEALYYTEVVTRINKKLLEIEY